MFKIAICEEDAKYIHFWKKIIVDVKEVGKEHIQFLEFASGEALLDYAEKDFDLIILEMQLSGWDGYETAKRLREYDKNLLIAFCSETAEPTPELFKVNPFRYLQKNLSRVQMLNEMKEILEEMKRRKCNPSVMCRFGMYSEKIRVYPEEILYIAIKNETTEIFPYGKLKEECKGNTLRASMTIEGMCKIFTENQGFVRAHNSYIINMAHIRKTHRESVVLADGTELTISRSHSKKFRETFSEFNRRTYNSCVKAPS